jgi:putative transcriptional regulator
MYKIFYNVYNIIYSYQARLALNNKIITNRIRRMRFEAGEMSQAKLAQKVGCTRQTINAIEAAKYGPSLELAFKIADVFGVGIEQVFQYEPRE